MGLVGLPMFVKTIACFITNLSEHISNLSYMFVGYYSELLYPLEISLPSNLKQTLPLTHASYRQCDIYMHQLSFGHDDDLQWVRGSSI